MVVKMMRWPPWPPLVSSKYEVKLMVRRLEGFQSVQDVLDKGGDPPSIGGGLTVEIRWRGSKAISLMSSLRRNVKREFTKEIVVVDQNDGVFAWDEEFQSVCNLSADCKDNSSSFHPWEISFTLLNGSKQGSKYKVTIIGTALLNLAEFASKSDEKVFELKIPLTMPGSTLESQPSLCITLSLMELRSIVLANSSSLDSSEVSVKDEPSALKAGLRKVKTLTEYVSSRRVKKAFREGKSDDADYSFDSDSFDVGKDGCSSSFRQSFNYGTLASVNDAGGSVFSSTRVITEDDPCVYYSDRITNVECSAKEDEMSEPVCESPVLVTSKRIIFPWRKRKLNFTSPMLKKAYGEEGGGDIDLDRRQLTFNKPFETTNQSSGSEFGDDCFSVGSWERKEIISRDGHLKIQTHVFFASIDQRSEKASGESACTALVAVIADWLHKNLDMMPIKSQFDSLILDGSFEWRNLCEDEKHKERFPDKHFDLETVLQADIRSISVHPENSFIGFFHPNGFDFLDGVMSFDGIWDEITSNDSEEPKVYIVSWNDHFFVLKIEPEAYYLIDTLGERLYEGCNQAYILKFDRDTKIFKNEVELVFDGKETCKEYITSFLAAIPISELLEDLKKGLASVPLHQRLQIEFHYTRLIHRQ